MTLINPTKKCLIDGLYFRIYKLQTNLKTSKLSPRHAQKSLSYMSNNTRVNRYIDNNLDSTH